MMRHVSLAATAFCALGALGIAQSPTSPQSAPPQSAPPQSAPPQSASTLLRDVTIIDGTGQAPKTHQDLLVIGGRIAAIGATGSLRVPTGTTDLAMRGRYVMPGLIDSHVHLATFEREPRIQDALLNYALLGGVTTVRDMGGNIREMQAIAERSRVNGAPLARLYYSAVMSGPQSMWFTDSRKTFFAGGSAVGASPGVRQVDSTSEIARVVRDAKATGATGLKLYTNLPPRVIAALAREGHRQGLRVWAHLAMWPGRPSDIVNGGVDAVSHVNMFMRELVAEVPPGAPESVIATDRRVGDSVYHAPSSTAPAIAHLLRAMHDRGTTLDATLYIVLNASVDAGAARNDSARARYLEMFRYSAAMTRAAFRAGIPIVAGTDGIGRQSPNLHTELQLLVDSAGLSPLAAIRAANSLTWWCWTAIRAWILRTPCPSIS